jgi:uncharacterized membrane protein YbhN (UPF0104 family)
VVVTQSKGAPARDRMHAMAVVDTPDRSLPIGRVSARQVIVLVVASAVMVAGLVVIAPALADLPDVWTKLSDGHLGWLAFALVLEALSFVGHAILFRAVSVEGGGTRIGLRASTEITLAGHAATRLFASAGAGGIALTAWALKRSGMEARDVAARMTTFMVLLYSVYMGSLLIGGVGLYTGLIPGGGSFAMTIVPALFGGVVIALVAAAQLVRPGEHRLQKWLSPIGDGVRDARRLIKRGNLGLLGAIMWWAFDIACLWACFKAFGDSPAVGVLVIGYFVGMLANTLPLPGGVGGVDGGMIGMFVAFGVNPATAIVAVLAYRFFAFWLPIGPGAVSYATLRRTISRWEAEDTGEALPAAQQPRRRPAVQRHDRSLCHQYS